MSLLQQESPEIDDASLGEEFTKGSSHVIWASIAATVLVTILIAAYVIAGQKPPAATGEIVGVWAHPIHNETSGVDANGAPMPKETFDQVLVFTRVRLHNQSSQPLFLHQMLTNATLDDGIHSSYAAIPADYERAFAAYPELAPLHGQQPWTDRRGGYRLGIQTDQTAVGRAQEPELYLRLALPAEPGARVPHRGYRAVTGASALLGVERYPEI
jgi:hypothetical protein